jgi:hypothetical protein
MKHFFMLLVLMMTSSCARKVEVNAPGIIRTEHYLYMTDDHGRVYIVTTNTRDFDEAMKTLHPGPASVNKLDLWVVTPAEPANKNVH